MVSPRPAEESSAIIHRKRRPHQLIYIWGPVLFIVLLSTGCARMDWTFARKVKRKVGVRLTELDGPLSLYEGELCRLLLCLCALVCVWHATFQCCALHSLA